MRFIFLLFALIIGIEIPFLFFYFIYRLIKGLMKYHHDLKSGDGDGT